MIKVKTQNVKGGLEMIQGYTQRMRIQRKPVRFPYIYDMYGYDSVQL